MKCRVCSGRLTRPARVIYVGITYADRFKDRVAEHGERFAGGVQRLVEVASRVDAKGVEQVLIEHLPNLQNIYNSIARANPIYEDATRRGLDILVGVGFRFPK